MKNKSTFILALLLTAGFAIAACGPGKKVKISEKSKKLFGKAWTYDVEGTRTAVLTKTGKKTGIKNLKDIKLKGDVKKMADFLTHQTMYIFPDKKGKGIGYKVTTGKFPLQSKRLGWLRWNADETEFTLENSKDKKKSKVYKIVEVTPNKLVILNKASVTKTPEVWKR